jgi:nicotinamide-nucleotide amidase
LEQIEREFQKNLGEALYGIDDETLEGKVGKLLTQLNLTLAVAESCTGGLITHRLTNVPGSSDYLERAVISYSNRSKEEILGISPQTLKDYGAVSPQTATAMAEGIRRLARSDIGLSVTGIAGPGGGTEEKPVGLVYIALAYGAETRCHRYQLHGNRTTIKRRSAQTALDNLRRYLLSVTMNAS